MFFVYGARTYGHVDYVDGVGHVATEFGHIFWFPLFPKESILVTDKKWNGVEGIPIRMSFKSVGFAYIRALAILFTVAGVGALNLLFDPTEFANLSPEKIETQSTIVALGAFALVVYLGSLMAWATKADYETATSVVEQANLGEPYRTIVELSYERITDVEAERRLDELDPAAKHEQEHVEYALADS